MRQQRLRLELPPLLGDEGQHRLHDHHRIHPQLLPLLHRIDSRGCIRPQGDLTGEAVRVLVCLCPVQMGEMWAQESAEAVYRQRCLPAAAGLNVPTC